MVAFKLTDKTAESLTYLYYPEGDENQVPGVIVADPATGYARVTEVAEGDSERDISPEELNQFADVINEMVLNRGASSLIGYTDEPVHIVSYGDHAVREIERRIDAGEIPEKGSNSWY